MRSERVWFGFFVILALTLNFGFVYGDISNPEHHDKLELFFAFIVSVVCTILKFGDRSHLGSLMLATSLVADVQLLCAIFVWTFSVSLLEASTMATRRRAVRFARLRGGGGAGDVIGETI